MDPTALPSNPQDDARPELLGVTLTMTALAVVIFGLRLYVRLGIVKGFGADDIIMAVSTALMVALEAVIIVEVKHGHGRHIGDIPPERYMVGMKYNFISQPMAFVCTNMIKLSVGAALLRIAATRFWKTLIWSVMGFMIFYTIGAFFTIIFQCRPVQIQWDQTVEGTCWEPLTLQALAYTSIVLNILTDLLFAIVIPLPMLWRLNLNRRTKSALLFVLSLGTLACAAAAVRFGYIASYGVRVDYLWDTRKITIWYVVEATVGIIAGSLPALKPLFTWIIGSTKRYASGKGSRFTGHKTPHESGVTSGHKSASMWKSKGSRLHTTEVDDNESERGLNISRSQEALGHPLGAYPNRGRGNVATVERDAYAEGLGDGSSHEEAGIMKTTTTTMSFLNN